MRIGELAKRSGLSRDTIRFYEKHGLIASTASTSEFNTYRDYAENLVERLDMIVQAREAGLSVADLELLISHLEFGADPNFDVDDFLQVRIDTIRQTIARSRRFLKFLEQTKAALGAQPMEWR